jgi:hypothetical protein
MYAAAGFIFGTLGLFLLAALSLVSPAFEMLAAPFMWPGRFAAERLFGAGGSTAEVLLLTVGSGMLYAAVGYALSFALPGKAASPAGRLKRH